MSLDDGGIVSIELPTSAASLVRELIGSITEDDLEQLFVESTVADAMKRLGEMRLLALAEEGIVGITELGRRVLVGLLFYAYKSACEDTSAQNAFGASTLHALRILCYEQLPDELRTEFERLVNGGDPS